MAMKIKENALYTLDELSEEARERAYNEWLDEYRDSYEWTCDVVYSDTVYYGDKALASVGINAEWDSWDNCFPGNYADPYSGRVYYSDNRKWYTVDGELYEQSNVSHECVSLVKTA